MPMNASVHAQVPDDTEVVGVPVFADRTSPPRAGVDLDWAYLTARGFEAKPGESQLIAGGGTCSVVALGMGDAAKVDAEILRRAGAALIRSSWRQARVATTLLDAAPPGLDAALAAQAVVEGASLASYRFTRYKADPKPCRIESLAVVGPEVADANVGQDSASIRRGVERGSRIAAAVTLARDLVNEPAAAMTPSRLAETATEIARREGLAVSVLDEVAIASEGLGGLAGVAQGSLEPARLIELVYDPPGAQAVIALVGKGITFDSGGLSIKTAEGMETMKTDMSGAAAVLAAMSVLPALAPPVKVIAIIPTTENMPGNRAVKPGDVLRIRNGKTVEVLNTDAEGRLVLADGLSLAAEAGVDAIIDVATLTGACMVALGRGIAGLMGNHRGWMGHVRRAADRAGESVWPLPLPEQYRAEIDSEVADLRNIGTGRYGGALTAGLFLAEFTAGLPWAHLDIAGPARSENSEGYLTKGGTGFGVRTLVEAITGLASSPSVLGALKGS